MEIEYSILLSSRNEGESLRRTVGSLLQSPPPDSFEIIVVDDASEDSSTEFLAESDYSRFVRVFRNESQRGLIFSRALAAKQARGEYLCVLDAHCRVAAGWLEKLRERLAGIDDRGIVVPSICRLNAATWETDDSSSGRACTISNPFLDFAWCEPREVDGLSCTNTIAGGVWMCSRHWYSHVGGLDADMLLWGGENIDLALRTWLLGGWCLLASDVEIGHLYRAASGVPRLRDEPFGGDPSRGDRADSGGTDPAIALAYNKIRAAHNAFEKATMQKVIHNLKLVPGFTGALDLVQKNARSMVELKEHVESRRKRSDRWLIETFELPLLDAPFFHRAHIEGKDRAHLRARPRISVFIPCSEESEDLENLVSSLLEMCSYGRSEVHVVHRSDATPALGFLADGPLSDTRRLRCTRLPRHCEGGALGNRCLGLTDSEYLVFLSENAVIQDPHWLERFIMLFERRPRLLMASPRIQWVSDTERSGSSAAESFDLIWDWSDRNVIVSTRQRAGLPLACYPYQAVSCPEACFMVHRERLDELGGFDATVERGPLPLLDLAVRGWLSGYEVFCHPGILMGVRERVEPSVSGEWRHYAQALPVVKYFTNSSRVGRGRAASPLAADLLHRNRAHIRRQRSEFETAARFDDDWLFYKFGIEDRSPMDRVRRKVSTEMELRVSYAPERGRLSEVLRTIRIAGGDLKAHLVYCHPDREERVGLFVCEKPTEAGQALKRAGFHVDTAVVVTVLTENRTGALSHLVGTLEAEGLQIGYSYCTAHSETIFVVLRTDSNALAEDVLRNLLQLSDPHEPPA